jgi:hypothetical protein
MDDAMTLNQHSISRRTVLKATGVGADISWAPQMEAHGYYWKNANGVKEDILTILNGFQSTSRLGHQGEKRKQREDEHAADATQVLFHSVI